MPVTSSPSVDTTTVGFPNLAPRVAATHHQAYDVFQPIWQLLAHVREGIGGFLDGTYLIAHPREWLDHTSKVTITDPTTNQPITVVTANPNPRKPSPKLKARRAIARYENLAGSIMEAKKGVLFRDRATRRVGVGDSTQSATGAGLAAWWDDVDGMGTAIAEMMPYWWDLAATFGHLALFFDLPATGGDTAADSGQPTIREYTPLDILNWLTDEQGRIISIKVQEAVPAVGYEEVTPSTQYQIRIIDTDGWRVYDRKTGRALQQGTHGMGRLPVAWLFGKRRTIPKYLGQSVLGDPRNYLDLFNLASEKRELLRNQTFAFINVPLGTGPEAVGVEDAQRMMGEQIGTGNVIFTPLPASMLAGPAENITTYLAEEDRLRRTIYRETGIQWDADSKDAEAEGSLKIKRDEMNVRMATYADACQEAEYDLADCWYRWRYGADAGPVLLAKDEVTIQYPDKFDLTPFEELLKQVDAAQRIQMPESLMKLLKKSIVMKFEGLSNLTATQLEAINRDIDAAVPEPTPGEMQRERMELQRMAIEGKVRMPLEPPEEE